MATEKAKNPIERQIFLKDRLIKNLQREIKDIRAETAEKIEKINFRIKMALVLKNALQKSR